MGYLISLILFWALIVFGMGSYGFAFVDIASLLLILPAFFLAAAAAGWRSLWLSFGLAFATAPRPSPQTIRTVRLYLRTLGNSGLWMGAIGFLTGLILVLHHMNDPARIGPALATALLTPFYALLCKLLCFTTEKRVTHRFPAGR